MLSQNIFFLIFNKHSLNTIEERESEIRSETLFEKWWTEKERRAENKGSSPSSFVVRLPLRVTLKYRHHHIKCD